MTPEELNALIERKFGKQRGNKTAAATALNIHKANLSSALNGSSKFPQKYVDALLALPDYKDKCGVEYTVEHGRLVRRFYTPLTAQAETDLEICGRMHTTGFGYPDFEANEEQTQRFFELILRRAVASFEAEFPDDVRKVREVMAEERRKAADELDAEAKRSRYLVADELDDPLA